MSIEFRCLFNISLLTYQCINNLTPSYLNFFSFNNNRTRAATRFDLKIPFAKKDLLKNSFRVQGAKIYNSLPRTIRESCNFNVFKRASFKHFMSKFFSNQSWFRFTLNFLPFTFLPFQLFLPFVCDICYFICYITWPRWKKVFGLICVIKFINKVSIYLSIYLSIPDGFECFQVVHKHEELKLAEFVIWGRLFTYSPNSSGGLLGKPSHEG